MLRTLLLSCHPLPTAAVTAYGTVLGVMAAVPAGRLALFAAAVLTGQLAIGWSNDYIDAGRDRVAGRTDKPLATDATAARVVELAAAAAAVATVVLSLLLPWRAGIGQLVLVASGLAYNAGLKRTVLSWLPYATGFGALPAAAVLAARHHPAAWVIAVGALLGVAAHLANVLPDLTDDAATGVRGFPHRLGARLSALLMLVLLAVAVTLAALGPAGAPSRGQWAGFGVGMAVLAAAVPAVLRKPTARAVFYGVVVLAGLAIVLLAVSGTRLT
jgi:4-hydroxybenzoate polyprenyltransferase